MRVIWWKIARPEGEPGPVELMGDTLNIHLPDNWSPVEVMKNGEHDIDRDWLNRLLAWSDGAQPNTQKIPPPES